MEDLACAVLKQMYKPDEPHDFKILVVTGDNTWRNPYTIVMKIQAFKNLEHIIVQWGLPAGVLTHRENDNKFIYELPFAADEMNLLATQMSENFFKIGFSYDVLVLEHDKTVRHNRMADKFCVPISSLSCNHCVAPKEVQRKKLTEFLHLYCRMRKAKQPNKEDV